MSIDEDDHPSLHLFDALDRLYGDCDTAARLFGELDNRRAEARQGRSNLGQIVGEVAAERAKERVRQGEHLPVRNRFKPTLSASATLIPADPRV